MPDGLTIRETSPGDIEQVLALYPKAFPDEELRPVVSALLGGKFDVLSLAAFDREALVGHVLFTNCGTDEKHSGGALLGPLGVLPSYQQKGVGSALVKAGLERLDEVEIQQAFVLGDPAYYKRFGFIPEGQVLTPYPMPEEWAGAWQSMPIGKRKPLEAGRLMLPEPWMHADLWAP